MARLLSRTSSERSYKAKRNWYNPKDSHGKVKIIRPSYVKVKVGHPPALLPFNEYSKQSYTLEWTARLRRSVRTRDGYCMTCTTKDKRLDVHHINYQKIDCNPWNLITLCKDCHKLTNRNRQYWYPHLYELIRLTYRRNTSLPEKDIMGMVRFVV